MPDAVILAPLYYRCVNNGAGMTAKAQGTNDPSDASSLRHGCGKGKWLSGRRMRTPEVQKGGKDNKSLVGQSTTGAFPVKSHRR